MDGAALTVRAVASGGAIDASQIAVLLIAPVAVMGTVWVRVWVYPAAGGSTNGSSTNNVPKWLSVNVWCVGVIPLLLWTR